MPFSTYSASELPSGWMSTCDWNPVAVFVADRIVNLPLAVDCPGEIGGPHPPTVQAAVGDTVRFVVHTQVRLHLAVVPAGAARVSGDAVTLLRPVPVTITAQELCAPGADGRPNPPRCVILTVVPISPGPIRTG